MEIIVENNHIRSSNMNQINIYPHQIYRKNTLSELHSEDSRMASPSSGQNQISTNQKEINIRDYELQKQKRLEQQGPSSITPSEKCINEQPQAQTQKSKRERDNFNIGQTTSMMNNQPPNTKVQQTKSIDTKQQGKYEKDNDDDSDIFDKKPKSITLINDENSQRNIDALQKTDQPQKSTPQRNYSLNPNEIDLLKSNKEVQYLANRPTSNIKQQISNKEDRPVNKDNVNSSNNKQNDALKIDINVQKTKTQSNKDTSKEESRPNSTIQIGVQDIKLQKEQPSDNPKQERDVSKPNQTTERGSDNQQTSKKSVENSSLLKKYKLEQEYLKGIKQNSKNGTVSNSINNQSVLSDTKQGFYDQKVSEDINNGFESDQSEDTRLNNRIKNYRQHYRKNIDDIYKQIKTEHNSPANRSIYFHEEAINNKLKDSGKVQTEPSESSKTHNLQVSKPQLNFHTTLPPVDEDNNSDLQYQSKTVPIHVILGKIRSRSNYTQRLEIMSNNINHGQSPVKSYQSNDEITQSYVTNDYIRTQRQNLTSKKYLNMYTKTIDSMHNQDQYENNKRAMNSNNSTLSSNQNTFIRRNTQKSNGGLNEKKKKLDVQKLNEEIDMLEQQSKAYQKSLNTSMDFETDQSFLKNNSMTIEEAFKTTLSKNGNSENPRDTAKQLVKIGLIYYSQNQYNVSSQKLLKALQILKKERLQKDVLYQWVLEHLGNIYKSWGENDQAFVYYKECYTIRKKLENPNLKQLTQAVLNIAQLLIQSENYQNATQYLQELLSITAAKVQKNNEWRVKVQLTLAICLGQCRENKSAYNIIYEQLEQIVSTFDLRNNRDILELILQSVEIIENDHNQKDILSFYQKIKPLVIENFGQTNEVTLRVKERIEELSGYF